jgi:hypothetical protein
MAKVAKKKSKNLVAKSARSAAKKATPAKKRTAVKKAAPKKAAPKKAAPKKAAPKKAAPKKAAPALKKTTMPKRPPAERDTIDQQALRARSGKGRMDGANAFLPDPSATGHRRVKDDFAEGLGEEFVATATSGESADDERDAPDPEEDGGPFITTNAKDEYGQGTDASNPADAEREAFPTTRGGR